MIRRSALLVSIALLLGVGCTNHRVTVLQSDKGQPAPPDAPVQSPVEDAQLSIQNQLDRYTILGKTNITLDGIESTAWHVKAKEGALVGVFVQVGTQLVPLREPVLSAGGAVGPWFYQASLQERDLDADGTPEYVLSGVIGAHSMGLWIYRYDSERFLLLGSLAGDRGVSVVDKPDGKVMIKVVERDYSNPDVDATNVSYWVLKHEHLERVDP